MKIKSTNKTYDMMEVLGLSVLCLFVTYLFYTELTVSKKNIPDLNTRERARI